jgi:simple sugar transport system ATP-binding protein
MSAPGTTSTPTGPDAAGDAPGQATLQARGIGHSYGRVRALHAVALDVPPGRVTCLLGDNGAGKSTLIRVLAGVIRPDRGTLAMDGRPLRLDGPGDARRHGIATLFQELALIPLMSVWRNFFLGAEPTTGRGPLRRIDSARCRATALEEVRRLGIELDDADRPAGALSGGQRQALAMARAAYFGARFLILDEPTAALAVNQADAVLRAARAAADRGLGVLLVTHNPRHAFQVGDHFVLLRQGAVAARHERDGLTAAGLAALMAGAEEPTDDA